MAIKSDMVAENIFDKRRDVRPREQLISLWKARNYTGAVVRIEYTRALWKETNTLSCAII